MTADTPVYVCAYSNNQYELSGVTEDPMESGCVRAIREAKGRTITILDKEGIVFTRVWCMFENFLTLPGSQEKARENSKEGLWAIYMH